jgi:hypothetical protein
MPISENYSGKCDLCMCAVQRSKVGNGHANLFESLQFTKQHICGLIPLSQICTFLRYASPEIANPHFLGLIRKTQKKCANVFAVPIRLSQIRELFQIASIYSSIGPGRFF